MYVIRLHQTNKWNIMTNLTNLLIDLRSNDTNLSNEIDERRSPNVNDGLIFEDIFLDRLTQLGFTQLPNSVLSNQPQLKHEILSSTESLIENTIIDVIPNGSFIAQPFGSQSFPDFIVFDCDKVICVELKYSKNSKPMWNNSLPRQHALYVFLSNQKSSGSDLVLFKGSDVISVEMESVLKEYGRRAQHLATEAKSLFESLDEFGYGFNLYNRVNFQQTHYNNDTNTSFTTNENRLLNERRVIQFLSDI